jgi:hypothetical protein
MVERRRFLAARARCFHELDDSEEPAEEEHDEVPDGHSSECDTPTVTAAREEARVRQDASEGP